MKRITIFVVILLFIVSSGCRTTAWYQEGKSFIEASKDCEECKYEVMKYNNINSRYQTMTGFFVGSDTELFMQCMKLRGYIWADVTDGVKNGWLKIREDVYDPWRTVAGN